VAKIAKHNNCYVSLDIEPQRLRKCPPEILDELLELADIIFCNKGALDLLGETNNPNISILMAKKRIRGVLIATLGVSGCLIVNEKGKKFHMQAYKITQVDTTGAGDCFAAAFIYGFLQEWDIEKCGSFANAAGAISTTRLGARGALPTKQEIEIFMKHAQIRSVSQ
jgi:ribokinase